MNKQIGACLQAQPQTTGYDRDAVFEPHLYFCGILGVCSPCGKRNATPPTPLQSNPRHPLESVRPHYPAGGLLFYTHVERLQISDEPKEDGENADEVQRVVSLNTTQELRV